MSRVFLLHPNVAYYLFSNQNAADVYAKTFSLATFKRVTFSCVWMDVYIKECLCTGMFCHYSSLRLQIKNVPRVLASSKCRVLSFFKPQCRRCIC